MPRPPRLENAAIRRLLSGRPLPPRERYFHRLDAWTETRINSCHRNLLPNRRRDPSPRRKFPEPADRGGGNGGKTPGRQCFLRARCTKFQSRYASRRRDERSVDPTLPTAPAAAALAKPARGNVFRRVF